MFSNKITQKALADSRVELERVTTELAGLQAQVKALRTEKDHTVELNTLKTSIENLKIEKSRLTEDNDRKVREVEHKTGLLRTQQEHEVTNATREATLKVREENLDADKKRFKDEMDFQRTHLQKEVDRIEKILETVLGRLPDVTAHIGHDTKAK